MGARSGIACACPPELGGTWWTCSGRSATRDRVGACRRPRSPVRTSHHRRTSLSSQGGMKRRADADPLHVAIPIGAGCGNAHRGAVRPGEGDRRACDGGPAIAADQRRTEHSARAIRGDAEVSRRAEHRHGAVDIVDRVIAGDGSVTNRRVLPGHRGRNRSCRAIGQCGQH